MHNLYAALLIGFFHRADADTSVYFGQVEISLCYELKGIKHVAFSFP